MGLGLILTVLAFSVNCAAWSDFVKPGALKEDGKFNFKKTGWGERTVYYYEKAHGCHKGYHMNCTSGEFDANYTCKDGKCKPCKDLKPEDTHNGVACKDYTGDDKDMIELGCYCKGKKWIAGSCPNQVKGHDATYKDQKDLLEDIVNMVKEKKKFAAYKVKECLFKGCMPYSSKARCSGLAVWAFIVIIVAAVLVVVAIVVVVIIIILKLRSKPTTKVDPTPAAESKAAAPPAEAPPPEVVGPSVLIKLGKQEIRTKKAADGPTAVWGEAVVFTGLGAEDDDVIIEVNGDGGEVLGTAEQRIPEYVNNKKRAVLTLKNGEADAGVLEVDIEIQVQEEPEVKITGVFFVDKYTKPV